MHYGQQKGMYLNLTDAQSKHVVRNMSLQKIKTVVFIIKHLNLCILNTKPFASGKPS